MIFRANRKTAFLPFVVLVIFGSGGVWADASGGAPLLDAVRGSYVAPASPRLWRMRQPDGTIREWECDWQTPQKLYGPGKWHGRVDGDRVHLWSRPDDRGNKTEFEFVGGYLRKLKDRGETYEVDDAVPTTDPDGVASLWIGAPAWSDKLAEAFDTWRGKGRLRLGYVNPNRAAVLLAELALLVACLLFARRRAPFILGALGTLVLLATLAQTASRGGFVAFLAGFSLLSAFGFRKLSRSRKRALPVMAALLMVTAYVSLSCNGKLSGARFGSRLFARDSSNSIRLEMWRETPRMMVDAPGGWGFLTSGRAFIDWYQPITGEFTASTLVNDHLTKLVAFGWPMRFVWIFGWLGVLALLLAFAVRGGSPFPLAEGTVLAIGAWFNPVLASQTLWILPLAGLWVFVRTHPWRSWRWYLGWCASAAVVTAVILCAVAALGEENDRQACPSIRTEGRQVLLNGGNPRLWLVGDDCVLGTGIVEKQIRLHYRDHREYPALGYVYAYEDLPHRPIGKLVLTGRSCAEFMAEWVSRSEAERCKLPESILFISPPFPAVAIPDELRARCNVHVVVGEFAARFDSSYQEKRPWVTIVPGAELFIPGWMTYVTAL